MNDLIELSSDGFYWPKSDSVMRKYIYENDRLNEPTLITQYCEKTRLCLQCGGNVGFYPLGFAKFFDSVITFEPDAINFECLQLNIEQCNAKNITAYLAALGNENGKISLQIDINNCGGHNVGRNIEDGNIQMMKIDDLELNNLDLLAIDVEGFEIECLMGGINTIKKWKPIISAEIGWSDCTGFLSELGYHIIGNIDVNRIFKYG